MGAIERFVRPVTHQNFPDDLLPQPLREANPLHLWRVVDGELTQDRTVPTAPVRPPDGGRSLRTSKGVLP
ncbi:MULTISPECIES: hypothetical protein [Streptomyces]|nr:hypothetical protein [Streptomyces canarius]